MFRGNIIPKNDNDPLKLLDGAQSDAQLQRGSEPERLTRE